MAKCRVVAVVQARMGSSRFPGKSLRPLAGRPMVAHVVARALAFSEDVVVATSRDPRDDALVAAVMALRLGVPVVRGSETDVLDRVHTAAQMARADVVVRVTGDCPLWAPDVAFRTLLLFHQLGVDYAWNDTAASGYPDGTDVEVVSREALDAAWEQTRAGDGADREHVTPWVRRNRSVATLRHAEDLSRLKLSVDHAADFARVQRIMAFLPSGAYALDDTVRAAKTAGEL